MDNKPAESQTGPPRFNLTDYWAVLLKRKRTILLFAIPVLVIVTVASFAIKPIYTATGSLLIEKEPNILTFEQPSQLEPLNDDYYQTQFKLLQSRTLAGNTIEKLKLYDNDKFAGKLRRAYGASDEPNSIFRRKLTDQFLNRLSISPIRQTRMVEVRFKDHEPKFAADTLNALIEAFIDMNVQIKYDAAAQAGEFLTRQISSLRADIAKNEQELQNYGVDKNIVTLNDKETTIVEKLGELNKALTEAEVDRIKKESYYNMVRGVSPESIPEALSNPLIQRLREDYNKLSREYLKMQERFEPGYPELQRVKTELESAKASLLSETQNLLKGAYSDWQAAVQKEKSLEEVFNNQKQQAVQLNSNSIIYNSLKIEIENKKNLMEALLKRQSETDVSAQLKGIRASNVRIVDRAEPPLYPSSPKKKLNIAVAFLIGLLGGAGLAFLREHLDDSIKTFDDVQRYSGLPSLGFVPAFDSNGFHEGFGYASSGSQKVNRPGVKIKVEKNARKRHDANSWLSSDKSKGSAALGAEYPGRPAASPPTGERTVGEPTSIELIPFESPTSAYSESYRSIRSSLLLSPDVSALKCLAVASPLAQEGKTSTTSNLAVTLAQAGKSVLIVDSDLRRPRQHRIFKMPNTGGLSNFLTGTLRISDLIKPTKVPNLFLINAGPVPINPNELLGSEKMTTLINDLRRLFDYVLFDTPPLLAVTDGLVLATRLDGLILVVWSEKTPREALKTAKEKLDMAGIKTLGVIVNSLVFRKHDYYSKRHYYQSYDKDGQDKYKVQAG